MCLDATCPCWSHHPAEQAEMFFLTLSVTPEKKCLLIITMKPQNNSVWKEPWEVYLPILLHARITLCCSGFSLVLKISKNTDSTACHGSLSLCLNVQAVRIFLLTSSLNSSCFKLCSSSLVLPPCATVKHPALSSRWPYHKHWQTATVYLQCLLLSTVDLTHSCALFLYWGCKTVLKMCSEKYWIKGNADFPSSAGHGPGSPAGCCWPLLQGCTGGTSLREEERKGSVSDSAQIPTYQSLLRVFLGPFLDPSFLDLLTQDGDRHSKNVTNQ